MFNMPVTSQGKRRVIQLKTTDTMEETILQIRVHRSALARALYMTDIRNILHFTIKQYDELMNTESWNGVARYITELVEAYNKRGNQAWDANEVAHGLHVCYGTSIEHYKELGYMLNKDDMMQYDRIKREEAKEAKRRRKILELLDQDDLLNMLEAQKPYKEEGIEFPLSLELVRKGLGSWNHKGNRAEYWQWCESNLQKLSNAEILDIYYKCKEQWE